MGVVKKTKKRRGVTTKTTKNKRISTKIGVVPQTELSEKEKLLGAGASKFLRGANKK